MIFKIVQFLVLCVLGGLLIALLGAYFAKKETKPKHQIKIYCILVAIILILYVLSQYKSIMEEKHYLHKKQVIDISGIYNLKLSDFGEQMTAKITGSDSVFYVIYSNSYGVSKKYEIVLHKDSLLYSDYFGVGAITYKSNDLVEIIFNNEGMVWKFLEI